MSAPSRQSQIEVAATDWCIDKGVHHKEHFAFQAGAKFADDNPSELVLMLQENDARLRTQLHQLQGADLTCAVSIHLLRKALEAIGHDNIQTKEDKMAIALMALDKLKDRQALESWSAK